MRAHHKGPSTLLALLGPILLASVACGAEAPGSTVRVLPEKVLLGTFTGEIDTDAGTITLRPDLGPLGAGRTGIAEITAVSVSNASSAATGNLCTGGGASLGAQVRIAASPFVSTNLFTDVYAQIQSNTPTGTEGCNGVATPGGLTDYGLGVWYYPSLGGTNGVTAYWAFKFVGGTRSTFRGKIYGTATAVSNIKTVFVTSGYYTGALGGVSGGNALCQARASVGIAAGTLPSGSTYKAFLSATSPSTVNAKDQLVEATYVRPDGRIVTSSKANLFSSGPLVPIQITESNTTHAGAFISGATQPEYVWTGTNPDGTVDTSGGPYLCSSWTTEVNGVYGRVGNASRSDVGWANMNASPILAGASGCWAPAFISLYCFQQ